MSLFGGGGGSDEARLGNVKFQATGYGIPIQLCYGTQRVYPTWIDYCDFIPTKREQSQGGKGFGDSSSTYYTYTATLVAAVCWGEIRGFGYVWKDKDRHPTTEETRDGKSGLSSLGFSGFTGTSTQALWEHFESKHPERTSPYRNIAYIAVENYSLGRQATIGTHSVETHGLCLSSNPSDQNHIDAHVKDVVTDFLNRAHYPSDKLGDLTLMHDYCAANGILISALLDTQKKGLDWLAEFIFIANAGGYSSQGKLQIKPYSDRAASNAYANYSPDLTIVTELIEGRDYRAIRPIFKNKTDCFNYIAVDYTNRQQGYVKTPAFAHDQADIEAYGIRKKDTKSLPHVCLPDVARLVAHNDLQHELYLDAKGYELELPIKFDYIECMDFVRLSNIRLGLNAVRCRVEAAKDDGKAITLTVYEALEGVAHGGEHSGAAGVYSPIYAGVPALINDPIIFVAPAELSAAGGEIWAGISCNDPLYGGCDVYLSYDGSAYKRVATHSGQSITGHLTSAFANNASTLSADISESDGSLDSYSQAAFDLKESLCRVGNEFIAYHNAALTETNCYNLTGFYRGLYDTATGASNSDKFLVCDDSLLKIWFKESLVNTTVYLKFCAFNYFGSGYQKLEDLTVYEFNIDNSGRISQTSIEVVDP